MDKPSVSQMSRDVLLSSIPPKMYSNLWRQANKQNCYCHTVKLFLMHNVQKIVQNSWIEPCNPTRSYQLEVHCHFAVVPSLIHH
jgi:hypothetical protein